MHRCLIKESEWGGGEITLGRDESHHLMHVLRARPGDAVTAFDGRGREAPAVVAGGGRGRIELTGEPQFHPRHAWELVLIQALPKGTRMDLVVEKATELGTAVICPVMTERVVAHLDEETRGERVSRWQRLALSAARQCGARWIPEVLPITDYVVGLEWFGKNGLLLVGSLQPGTRKMRDVLAGKGAACDGRKGIVIGPEGDLTTAEIDAAVAMGALPVSFGPTVLRTETAAIFALSVLAYECG